VAETLPGYSAGPWYGIFAPAGTPPDVVRKLNTEFNAALHSPEISEQLKQQGARVVGDTPEQFASFLKDESSRWSKVVRESGMRAN